MFSEFDECNSFSYLDTDYSCGGIYSDEEVRKFLRSPRGRYVKARSRGDYGKIDVVAQSLRK